MQVSPKPKLRPGVMVQYVGTVTPALRNAVGIVTRVWSFRDDGIYGIYTPACWVQWQVWWTALTPTIAGGDREGRAPYESSVLASSLEVICESPNETEV